MSKELNTINTASDSFDNWINRTNDIINVLATEAVTANSGNATSNSAMTSGNGFVSGYFGANTLVATYIVAGNVDVVADTLTVSSNTVFEYSIEVADQIIVGNSTVNTNITENSILINGQNVISPITSVTTTGTGSQQLYYFSLATYRSAELLISVKDNSANGYHLTKLLALHDGGAIHTTEYGTMYSNAALISTSASVNATHGIINVTPTSSSLTIKVKPTLIGV